MFSGLLREKLLKIVGLVRRTQRELELSDELAFHLAMKEQKYVEGQGMTKQEAAEQATRDLGGLERWKEVCRDVARWRWLEDFGRDLLLAARMLRKTPIFTAVAIFTLTAAIGANTAIFSLMNAILLKSLAVPAANRLAILRIQPDDFGYYFNYPLFKALQKKADPLFKTFAFTGHGLHLRTPAGIEGVTADLVSGNYFSALQIPPKLGRWIGPNDDRPGTPDGAVVVVSDQFWRQRLASDPKAIGRKVSFTEGAFTVVGVMPDSFRGMNKDEILDAFVPLELEPVVDAPFNSIAAGYRIWWFEVGAKLNQGVSIDQANALLRASSNTVFAASYPDSNFQFNGHKIKDLYLTAEPGAAGYSALRLRFRRPLSVLMIFVGVLLLIACLNLATLLMARAASRTREITTRFALGASRARILRQLGTENFLLAVIGTTLGFVSSIGLARLILTLFTSSSETVDTSPDLRIFLFTAAVALIATVLTGIAPALRSTDDGLNGGLREGSASIRGAERRRLWPRVLLVSEVGMALVLVTGASLLGYSFVKLHNIPLGFEPKQLVFFQLEMGKDTRNPHALIGRYRDVLEVMRTLPGITGMALSAVVPLTGNWSTAGVHVPGHEQHEVWRNRVGPDFFRTMKTVVLEGREFRWTDTDKSRPVAILNASAARLLFPKQSPIGRSITLEDNKPPAQVVGVVTDVKYSTLRDASPPTLYSSIMQAPDSDNNSLTLLVRTAGAPSPVITAVNKLVRRIEPDIPTPAAESMEQTIAEGLSTERLMAALALFFGGLALLITAVGLYGTLAYTTERRTGEIGIRLALGAQRLDVISMIGSENGLIALVGCAAGIVGSLAASKLISSFLYSVSAKDPVIFGAAALLLLAVATAASLIPAIKAARIDPLTAIRYE